MHGRQTTYKDFQASAQGSAVAPVLRTLYLDTETPVSIYLKLRRSTTHSFLFESVEGGRSLGRYSIVGIDPLAMVSIEGGTVSGSILREEGEILTELFERRVAPLELLKLLGNRMSTGPVPGRPRFTGGWVGYFGYDSIRFVESIPLQPITEGHPPEIMLGLFTDVVIVDNVLRTVTIVSNVMMDERKSLQRTYDQACRRVEEIEKTLRSPLPDEPQQSCRIEDVEGGTDSKTYQSWVEKGREYIEAGDIFQVVLARYEVLRYEADPLSVYRALRRINPSPYMYYLSFGGLRVIGSSPEMLVRVEDGTVQTRPIAGTRPRGKSVEEDAAIAQELLRDAKERAEHLMLVDLARNDLGKICVPGSVHVPDFMSIEKYSHVMHICSTVSGTLRDQTSPLDALYACFPAGTLTGAPKVRAMQIISEIEPTRRGVYGGAVGYIDFSGNLDTCIAIRTIVERHGEYRLQAGAGIVYDSVPSREFEETVSKMTALQEAMSAAANTDGAV